MPRLGPGGPPAGLFTSELRREQESHPLIGADVKQIDAKFRQAMDGRTQGLQDLFDDMVDRDDRVAAVKSTRILAVQSRPWSVRPARGWEEDKEAQKIAAACSTIVARIRSGEGGGWASCVGQVADAIMRGYSVNEIEWGVSREGWHVPKALHWRHPRRFGFTPELKIARMDIGDPYTGTPLVDTWGADKFVIHQPIAGHAAYPQRRGAMIGMVFPALFKRYGWRWWIKATERWGQPITMVNLPNGQEQLKDDALQLVRRLQADFAGVMWGGMTLEAVPGAGNLNPAIFRDLVDKADTAISIRGLGQNLTTEVQGGSYAAAKVSNLVRMDLLAADLMEFDAAATRQIIEPIVRYNWPGAPVPEYVSELAQRGEITVQDVQEGIFTENDYRRGKGHAAKEMGGDEYRMPMVAMPAAIGGPEFGADAQPSEQAPATGSTTSLNGAQVESLKEILTDVAAGLLPRESGVNMIVAAFGIALAQAEAIMGDIGRGFVQTPTVTGGEPVAPPGGAGADSPLSRTSRSAAPSSSRSTSPTFAHSKSQRVSELYRRLVE
jgi:phage gp29-like protein